jgi:hypothetical protein
MSRANAGRQMRRLSRLLGSQGFKCHLLPALGAAIMTKLDFISLCGELLIDPDVALSDDNVGQMLLDRADDDLREYLKNEF